MSNLRSRIERLEKRRPARKVPADENARFLWALESLFPTSPQTEPQPVDDNSHSPYLIFLDIIKSGEIEKEMERRGIPLPPEEEPAWAEWTKAHVNDGKWSDEVDTGPRRVGGHVEPY